MASQMLIILSQILLSVYELYFYLLKQTARTVGPLKQSKKITDIYASTACKDIYASNITLFSQTFTTPVLNKEYFRMENTAKRSCLCVTKLLSFDGYT
jgi:hypothetical protein